MCSATVLKQCEHSYLSAGKDHPEALWQCSHPHVHQFTVHTAEMRSHPSYDAMAESELTFSATLLSHSGGSLSKHMLTRSTFAGK